MITKIRIRNFRSFEDTTVELKPFNVLIGPNDSGKSNFFDAFRILRGMMFLEKIGDVFGGSGLFESALFQGSENTAISFDVEGIATVPKRIISDTSSPKLEIEPLEFEYSIEITRDKDRVSHISTEKLKLKMQGSRKRQYINRSDEITNVREEIDNKVRTISYHFDHDRCAISSLLDIGRHNYIRAIRYEIGFSSFYEFQPSEMKRPGEKKEKDFFISLDEDGSNLGNILLHLKESQPDKYEKLKTSLKNTIPSVKELEVKTIEKLILVSIKQCYNNRIFNLSIRNMSDGLVRFLGLLSIVYNPGFAARLFFEELENGIHPRRLKTVINLMKFLSSNPQPTQVFITTHSPYLVDCVEPEDVLVVDKSPTGTTTIKPIEDKHRISQLLNEFSLGEAWFSGELGGVP